MDPIVAKVALVTKVALRYQASLRNANKYGEPLYGYDSVENSYPVDDYPYGRRLRCKIRYWLEYTPRKGWRFCSQTQDPVKLKWNNPKKSTYADWGGAMYLDSQKHVQWVGVGVYTKDEDFLEFVKAFPKADLKLLKVVAKKKMEFIQGRIDGKVVWTVNGVPKPDSELEQGEMRKDLETWQQIDRLL
jgi:hypothetical protein